MRLVCKYQRLNESEALIVGVGGLVAALHFLKLPLSDGDFTGRRGADPYEYPLRLAT